MAIILDGQTVRKITLDGQPVKKVVMDGQTIYTASVTLEKAVNYYTHGTVSTINWDTDSTVGYTKATYDITIWGNGPTDGIFWAGIGTSSNPPKSPAEQAPLGSVLNKYSVNGNGAGHWTGTIPLSEWTRYYIYVGSYYVSNTNSGVSVKVTFE